MKLRVFSALAVILLVSPVLAQAPTPDSVRRSNEMVEQAGTFMNDQQPEKALALLADAIPMNPRNPSIPSLMAVCEFNIGVAEDNPERIQSARQHLDAAIELDPRWGEPFFFLGVLSFQQKDYRAAIFGWENSLQRGYRVKDSHANRAQALFFWGVALVGDPFQALDPVIDVFGRAVDAFEFLKDDLRFPVEERQRFHRFWIDSMINLSSVYLLSQSMPEAEGMLRRLISLEPTRYLHHYNLGLVLGRSEGGWKGALAEYQKSLELNENKSWIEPYPLIGYILSQLSQREPDAVKKAEKEAEAEGWFLRYLDKYPNSVDPLMRLGEHYELTRDYDKAIAAYRRGVEVDPLKFNLMNKLGLVLNRTGKQEEGERWVKLSAELARLDREGTRYHDGTRPGNAASPGSGAGGEGK